MVVRPPYINCLRLSENEGHLNFFFSRKLHYTLDLLLNSMETKSAQMSFLIIDEWSFKNSSDTYHGQGNPPPFREIHLNTRLVHSYSYLVDPLK